MKSSNDRDVKLALLALYEIKTVGDPRLQDARDALDRALLKSRKALS